MYIERATVLEFPMTPAAYVFVVVLEVVLVPMQLYTYFERTFRIACATRKIMADLNGAIVV